MYPVNDSSAFRSYLRRFKVTGIRSYGFVIYYYATLRCYMRACRCSSYTMNPCEWCK